MDISSELVKLLSDLSITTGDREKSDAWRKALENAYNAGVTNWNDSGSSRRYRRYRSLEDLCSPLLTDTYTSHAPKENDKDLFIRETMDAQHQEVKGDIPKKCHSFSHLEKIGKYVNRNETTIKRKNEYTEDYNRETISKYNSPSAEINNELVEAQQNSISNDAARVQRNDEYTEDNNTQTSKDNPPFAGINSEFDETQQNSISNDAVHVQRKYEYTEDNNTQTSTDNPPSAEINSEFGETQQNSISNDAARVQRKDEYTEDNNTQTSNDNPPSAEINSEFDKTQENSISNDATNVRRTDEYTEDNNTQTSTDNPPSAEINSEFGETQQNSISNDAASVQRKDTADNNTRTSKDNLPSAEINSEFFETQQNSILNDAARIQRKNEYTEDPPSAEINSEFGESQQISNLADAASIQPKNEYTEGNNIETRSKDDQPPAEINSEFGETQQNSILNNTNAHLESDKIIVKQNLLCLYDGIGNDIVQFIPLSRTSSEFIHISMNFPFNITKIHKIFNPFIQKAFELTREMKYRNIQPLRLYHATKLRHVESICRNNFNWRLSGHERGHRVGHGVNFTNEPHLAKHFCDKYSENVMILADVLVDLQIEGSGDMIVPPEGIDTAIRITPRHRTYVKFNDSEFCPLYAIYFSYNFNYSSRRFFHM